MHCFDFFYVCFVDAIAGGLEKVVHGWFAILPLILVLFRGLQWSAPPPARGRGLKHGDGHHPGQVGGVD